MAERSATSYLRNILTFVPSGALLDVGCGAGRLPQMAVEQGMRAIGIELNVRLLPKPLTGSLHYVGADAQTIPFKDQAFDAVSMNHVLEHLSQPQKSLQDLHRILKPNGFLFISVPNHEGVIPRLTVNWPGYIPWTHLWHFSPRTLLPLLKKEGFRVVKIYLRSLQTPPILSWSKRTVYRLLTFVQRWIGMGDELGVVAQKKI